MAFQEYKEDQSIHSMTTRQLRLYISRMGKEAQDRLNTMDLSKADKALKEAVSDITTRSGKVRTGSSNMDKSQMREMAYALRTFNQLDTESGYALKSEWQKNKARYEKFVQNRIDEGDEYWKQYKTEKGNISKKGYEDYKQFIGFMKEIESIKYQFTYKTLKQYGVNQMQTGGESKKRLKAMSKLLNKVYTDSKGKHLTTSQLVDQFNREWDDYVETHDFTESKPKLKAKKYKKSTVTVKVKKSGKKKSTTSVKTKVVGKMRDNAKVHR